MLDSTFSRAEYQNRNASPEQRIPRNRTLAQAERDRWKRTVHPPIPPLNGRVIRKPTIMMGVIAAREEYFERNPLPPTVNAVHVNALPRISRSPKVEADWNREKEQLPLEITRET